MSKKTRLDFELFKRGLVVSRSQAESYIKLGKVLVEDKAITKAGYFVATSSDIKITQSEQLVSRAGLKLASVAKLLQLNLINAVVLDVGSSTGGFTDYALKHGAKKVIAVDVGTNQLHPSLHGNPQIELHEQTDIRDFTPEQVPDIVLIDVSFISMRLILPHIATLSNKNTNVVAMLKPQFEAGASTRNKGVIKNDAIRRQILKDFENWVKQYFVIKSKSDSEVHGQKGNVERFYSLKKLIK